MNQAPKTRASLILRLRRPEDAAAWAEFVEIYQPLVFRLACSRGLQQADALDLTQEVLARVVHAINQFEPGQSQGTFRGWISQITRNLVIDFFRHRRRQPLSAAETPIEQLIQAQPSGPETAWFDAEHERQVFAWAADKICDSFRPATWQAFWLTAVEDRSVAEAAEALQLSPGAIYVARSRVMARLKAKVKQYQSTDSGGSS